jgi:hypothetical protein
VPVQLVDATPSELKALIKGGVYDPKETDKALGSATSRVVESLESRRIVACDWSRARQTT